MHIKTAAPVFDVSAALACHCSLRPLWNFASSIWSVILLHEERKMASITVRRFKAISSPSIHSLDATTRCVMFLSETKHHTSMASMGS